MRATLLEAVYYCMTLSKSCVFRHYGIGASCDSEVVANLVVWYSRMREDIRCEAVPFDLSQVTHPHFSPPHIHTSMVLSICGLYVKREKTLLKSTETVFFYILFLLDSLSVVLLVLYFNLICFGWTTSRDREIFCIPLTMSYNFCICVFFPKIWTFFEYFIFKQVYVLRWERWEQVVHQLSSKS